MAEIFIAGDVLNYTCQDGKVCHDDLEKIVRATDFAVCNFEAPISGSGRAILKAGPNHSQLPSTVDGLARQGFDLLLLANNHIMDFGPKGLFDTMARARAVGLEVTGAGMNAAEAYTPLVRHIGDTSVGFVNACEAQFGVLDDESEEEKPGYAWLNSPCIDQAVIDLKNTCDFVVVIAHAGLEGYSVPQKEWRTRYRHLCRLGANFVVAAHPHVPQGYERYGDSTIFYSLGNFYFDSPSFRGRKNSSYSVCLHLQKGQSPSFDLVFHEVRDGRVGLAAPEDAVDVAALNAQLNGEIYDQLQDRMNRETWSFVRRGTVISYSTFPVDGVSMLGTLRLWASMLLRRFTASRKAALGLHMLRNETYGYVAKHCLQQDYKKAVRDTSNEIK